MESENEFEYTTPRIIKKKSSSGFIVPKVVLDDYYLTPKELALYVVLLRAAEEDAPYDFDDLSEYAYFKGMDTAEALWGLHEHGLIDLGDENEPVTIKHVDSE